MNKRGSTGFIHQICYCSHSRTTGQGQDNDPENATGQRTRLYQAGLYCRKPHDQGIHPYTLIRDDPASGQLARKTCGGFFFRVTEFNRASVHTVQEMKSTGFERFLDHPLCRSDLHLPLNGAQLF